LHRPDRLNAFTETMDGVLVAAFDAADAMTTCASW
jgi:enoyl-CoA hydratase/carnithine racemase